MPENETVRLHVLYKASDNVADMNGVWDFISVDEIMFGQEVVNRVVETHILDDHVWVLHVVWL